MELHERVDEVVSANDLADFVAAVRTDLERHGREEDEWENPTLEGYLEAMEAWIRDALVGHSGSKAFASPNWQTFARILLASKSYE